MTEHRHSRAEISQATNIMFAPDVEERLLKKRDQHAEVARLALRGDPPDYAVVNEHDSMALLYYEAAETIRRLKTQNAAMALTLRGRQ